MTEMQDASRSLRLAAHFMPRTGGTVSSRTQVALERAIALGLFAGPLLPSERDLSAALGVSRTALRVALRTLRESGYVDRSLVGRAGGVPTGVAVRRLPADEISAKAREALAGLDQIMELRRFLEPACARAAAIERSRSRVERLVDSQERLSRSPDQLAHRMTDGEFHYELAMASGSDEIVACVLRARADLMRWRDRLPMEDTVGHSMTEHLAIIEAVSEGDGNGAETAMREHLDNSDSLFRLFLHRYVEDPEIVLAEGEAAVARSLNRDRAAPDPTIVIDPHHSTRGPRARRPPG